MSLATDPVSIQFAKTQKAASNEVRGNDLYETPACAVTSLLANVPDMPCDVWEPCAGRGAIAKVLAAHEHLVCASDKMPYHDDHAEERYVFFQKDFLECTLFFDVPYGCEAIITNPPYMSQLPAKMISHALTLVPRAFFLLRLAFLEGKSKRRCEVLDSGHLKTVYVYRDRLPRMHRDGWPEDRRASSTTAFAWFEFDREYNGPPIIKRINTTDIVNGDECETLF